MRVITLCIALLFPALAFAESDYSVEWSISSPIGDSQYDSIILDINLGTQSLSANGMFRAGNLASPATGTCIMFSNSNIFCTLSVGVATFTLELLPSLSGTVAKLYGDTGENSESSLVQVVSIQ